MRGSTYSFRLGLSDSDLDRNDACELSPTNIQSSVSKTRTHRRGVDDGRQDEEENEDGKEEFSEIEHCLRYQRRREQSMSDEFVRV